MCGKGLAVVPLYALAQLEDQLGAILIPRPARRKARDDRPKAILVHMLTRLLKTPITGITVEIVASSCNRQARRTVAVIYFEKAA
jgi:hypothetical protein